MLLMGTRLRVTPASLMVTLIFSIAQFSTAVATGATWTATGSMANHRLMHTATLLANGKVLVAGGSDGIGSTSSAELYEYETSHCHPTGKGVEIVELT